ncbi:5-formaminoimidazole-4-carboxamide-1-(beta)-D-ribofuranosyl 5'-monophosphate synthetase [Candidatus Burarchaeum australiense]|nr:5-formaminoimidazole-4-carboxamide-1-(beta)-D-ribofuranosyl 5'-monophosphate synthetase [Candidatus Burarchaeum australiense]
MALRLEEIRSMVSGYTAQNTTIATIGSHSALDICDGAKEEGFHTMVLCQEGRETPYKRFRRIIDEIVVLPKFSDIASPEVQQKLRESHAIFVPNRSFSTYVGYDAIENQFRIPLFGSRTLLRAEERESQRNQYFLLEKAGIRKPVFVQSWRQIKNLCIVKVQEKGRKLERAFFTCSSPREFEKKAEERIRQKLITKEDVEHAIIEEFVVGALFNFNFFYSPLNHETEFLGADRRIQTNLDGILNLTADQQIEAKLVSRNIEIGHSLATVRESMLEKVFEIGDKFVTATQMEYPPGIIGPFALQGAITPELEIVIFDVSPRVPGSPVLEFSPYGKHYYGHFTSTGRRIAMEIEAALQNNTLAQVVT